MLYTNGLKLGVKRGPAAYLCPGGPYSSRLIQPWLAQETSDLTEGNSAGLRDSSRILETKYDQIKDFGKTFEPVLST